MSQDPRGGDCSHVNDQRKYVVYKKQKDPCLVGFFSSFNLSEFFNYHISSILDDFPHIFNISRKRMPLTIKACHRLSIRVIFFIVVHKIKVCLSADSILDLMR